MNDTHHNEIRIFDSHIHLPSEGWEGHKPYIPTLEGAIAFLKGAGIAGAVFTPWQGVFAQHERDLEEGNAAALSFVERYPGFLVPGASIHPHFPDTSRRWLERFRSAGSNWVGELVPYSRPYSYLDAAFLDLCALCEAEGRILQLHGHEDILKVAERFPALRLVFSHLHVGLLERLAGLPNVWQDFSGAAGLLLGNIEQAVAALGPDRVLFGTDFTAHDPRCHRIRLESAVPDPVVRRKIAGENLNRLLALGGMRPLGYPMDSKGT